jgi:hypothetical protein
MPRFEPQETIITFGDGFQAKAKRVIPGILGEDGEMETEIHMFPTSDMKRYHNIENGYRDPKDGMIKARYPSRMVKELNGDPIINTTLVLCDFECGDTIFTREYPDPNLLKGYVCDNRNYRAMVARLEDDKAKALKKFKQEQKDIVDIIRTQKQAGKDKYEEGYADDNEYGQSNAGDA